MCVCVCVCVCKSSWKECYEIYTCFHNIVFKIKYKIYVASGLASRNKNSGCKPASNVHGRFIFIKKFLYIRKISEQKPVLITYL